MKSTDEITALGNSLRRISSALLKPGTGDETIWFQGAEKYLDLFIEKKGDNIIWFQFTFSGNYVEWKKGQGLITGTTDEMKHNENSGSPTSKILKPDLNINLKFVKELFSILSVREDEPLISQTKKIIAEEITL